MNMMIIIEPKRNSKEVLSTQILMIVKVKLQFLVPSAAIAEAATLGCLIQGGVLINGGGGGGNPSKKLINGGVFINGGVRNSQKNGFLRYQKELFFQLFLKENIRISLRSTLQ